MTISIIIPTLNEAAHLGRLLEHLQAHRNDQVIEIIVADGGSTDSTYQIAQSNATALRSPKGRAVQMNYGAAQAKGEVLYFVHGDTLPPSSYVQDIHQALSEGYPIGCYRFRFDCDRPLLKINAYFTRFDFLWCRGGDQTLFVTRSLFDELDGYCERHLIMEEYDFIYRARKKAAFKIMPKDVIVSSRKYEHNGYLRVQMANLIAFNMFRFGFAQQKIATTYRRLLKG